MNYNTLLRSFLNEVYYNLKSTLLHPVHPFEYIKTDITIENEKNGNLTAIDDNDAIACA